MCGEMLMDAACDLNRPPWAAFHTVIEIHLLSGGGVREGEGERWRARKMRGATPGTNKRGDVNRGNCSVDEMKAERRKMTSLPLCYHCPWWPENSRCRCHFCYSASANADIIRRLSHRFVEPPADYIFFPLKHNLQHNHTAQFGDTLPASGRRAGRRGGER